MGRLWKIAVATVAVTAIAFSTVAGAALWHLWRYPPRLQLERTPEGFRWQGAGYTALINVVDARLDWLMLWRSREG